MKVPTKPTQTYLLDKANETIRQAKALLERWCTPGEDELLHDLTRAFLSRAPAQPAAPAYEECLSCNRELYAPAAPTPEPLWPGVITVPAGGMPEGLRVTLEPAAPTPGRFGYVHDLGEPAAPEPSAVAESVAQRLVKVAIRLADVQAENLAMNRHLEDAAVRIVELKTVLASAEAQLASVTGQYTTEDVVIILRAWRTLSDDAREAAWEAALLTPATSPGAGGGK